MATPNLVRRAAIGAAKRARTREQAIGAAIALVAAHAPEVPTLEKFIAAAGVARGTFYNHFRTKELLLQAASAHVADAIDSMILPAFEGIEDPARRVAIAIRSFIRICRERPEWGWVLVQTQPESGAGWSDGMRRGMLADIRAGRRSGRFLVPSVQAAAAVGFGVLANAIRAALVERTGSDYGEQVATMALRAFGVPPEESARVATQPLPEGATHMIRTAASAVKRGPRGNSRAGSP